MSDHEKKMQEWVTKGAEEIGKWEEPPMEHRCRTCYTRALCLVVAQVAVEICDEADQARDLMRVAVKMFEEIIILDPPSLDGEVVHCSDHRG